LYAALLLLCLPLWVIFAHLSLTDVPFVTFTWIACGGLITYLARGKDFPLWCGYFFLGLAFLVKGPLALFLTAVNLAIYLAITSENLRSATVRIWSMQPIVGALLSFSVAAPWYIQVTKATNGAFFREFFINQNINRPMGHIGHLNGPWYYIPVYLGGFFPFSLIALPLIAVAFRKRANLKERWQRLRRGSLAQSLGAFAALSTIVLFIIFSLVPSKLSTYILPAVPPFTILLGVFFDKVIRCKSPRLFAWLSSTIATIGLLLLMLVCITAVANVDNIVWIKKFKLMQYVKPLTDGDFYNPIALCLTMLSFTYLGCAKALSRSGNRTAVSSLIAATIISTAFLIPVGLKLAYEMKCRDFNTLLFRCEEVGLHPAIVGQRRPSALFYCQHPFIMLPDVPALVKFVNEHNRPQLMIVHADGMDFIEKCYDYEIKDTKGNWTVVAVGQKGTLDPAPSK
ncbi:MAG TPA: hypothetical protein V6C72_10160, partial [Chroococcales cyanobacterium]